MKEKFDELYEKYLNEKLDLIFHFHGVKKDNNEFDESDIEIIEKDGKYNIVKKIVKKWPYWKLLSPTSFDQIYEFKSGYGGRAVVAMTTKTMDKHGKLVTDSKVNLIDTNGKLISKEWYDHFDSFFHEGFIQVVKNGKKNYMDKNGKILSDEWFDEVDDFHNGVARVRKKSPHYDFEYGEMMPYKFDVIDNTGKRVFGNWNNNHSESKIINNSFVYVCIQNSKKTGTAVCTTKNLKDYNIKKIINGYSCINGSDKFNIKYKPLRIYDSRNIICYDKTGVYLFDRKIGDYTRLGSIPYIEFDDNYIFDLENKKTYLVYECQVHDITNYYNENIKGKENVTINKGIPILSKNEFFINQEEKIKKEAEETRRKKELSEIRARQTEEERRIQEIQNQDQKSQKEREIQISEAMRSIQKGIQVLDKYAKENKKIDKIHVDSSSLFIEVYDHKEINPLYIETGFIRYIDLAEHSFDGVKVSGIDFRGCNVDINPQEVYKNDLSNCNFEGVLFLSSRDFTGINIRGTKFTTNHNPMVFDINSNSFKRAIYDENTTLDGISLVELYENNKKK